jgi:hypothetical protein
MTEHRYLRPFLVRYCTMNVVLAEALFAFAAA